MIQRYNYTERTAADKRSNAVSVVTGKFTSDTKTWDEIQQSICHGLKLDTELIGVR